MSKHTDHEGRETSAGPLFECAPEVERIFPREVADMRADLAAREDGELQCERDRLSLAMRHPDGTHCSACGQFVKLYRRSFYATMARALIELAHLCQWDPCSEFIDITDRSAHFRDLDKLRHWGMVETMASVDLARRSSGRWRVTKLGIDFARGVATAPRWLHIFDDRVHEREGETTILEALGNKFDYGELMTPVSA